MKKFVVFVLLAAALSACSVTGVTTDLEGTASIQSLPADYVKLYYAKSVWYNQGNDYYGKVKGFIEIADASYEKTVMVRYIVAGTSTWIDIPAFYVKDLYGKEVWQFDLSGIAYDANNVFDIQFCIYYTVNGQTYWDNNDGQNYRLLMQPGNSLYSDVVLGKSQIAFSSAESYIYRDGAYDSVFFGKVFAQYLDSIFSIYVIYSTDNWNTTQSAICRHIYDLKAYKFYANVPADTEKIDFAFSYTVNGYTTWDNNFLDNYSIDVPAPNIQGKLW